MYVKDSNAKGLATDTAVVLLSDYIDALVSGEGIDPEELLRHAPGVDRENLAELFRIARERRDVLSYEYTPSGVRERIWQEINRRLES